MLILLLIIIFFTCFGLVWLEGLWNAALVLLNSLFAALIATSYFAPLAQVIESQLLPDFAYFWDCLQSIAVSHRKTVLLSRAVRHADRNGGPIDPGTVGRLVDGLPDLLLIAHGTAVRITICSWIPSGTTVEGFPGDGARPAVAGTGLRVLDWFPVHAFWI